MADLGQERDDAAEAALAIAARHALHDEELIAGFAVDGRADAADVARASSLIERCAACRDLHSDVQAISEALRVEARSTLAAPRDFRITEADARRLGGTISPRGFVRNLRRAMVNFGRPVGASMAALGFVGVLVGSLSFGTVAQAPTTGGDAGVPGAAPTDVRLEELNGAQATAPVKATDAGALGPLSTVLVSFAANESGRDFDAPAQPALAAALMAGSAGLVVSGLGLAWYAMRRSDRKRLDPSQFH